MMKNILLAGVGGQGTVLASKLIAYAAMDQGKTVKTAETIGMAQRGGSVVSHVRIGEGVFSPLIAQGTADVIIGFEPGEAVRMLPYLKRGGVLITSKTAVMPVTAALAGGGYTGEEMLDYLKKQVPELILVDTEQICAQCHSVKVLNVALLGAAAGAGVLDFGVEELTAAIKTRLPKTYHKMNLTALTLGAAHVRKN